jgi:hypothetical protein
MNTAAAAGASAQAHPCHPPVSHWLAERCEPPEPLDRGARLVFESGRPIAHAARDLGVPSETLRKYVRQVEEWRPEGVISGDAGQQPDVCVVSGAATRLMLTRFK